MDEESDAGTCGKSTALCQNSASSAVTTPRVLFSAAHCDYEVVIQAARQRGWHIVRSNDKVARCQVHWIDDSSLREIMPRIEAGMRVNHFPGTFDNLGRKSGLAKNIARMQRHFPIEFRFTPSTWVMPYEQETLERYFSNNPHEVFIVKPDNANQGRGIFLTNDLYKIRQAAFEQQGQHGLPTVVQVYIPKPMLLDGYKFDLRLYLLLCGAVKPSGLQLRSFLFMDGLVRLGTVPYEAPTPETLNQNCMHLTNYTLNRRSCDFQQNADASEDFSGSKRSLRCFLNYIGDQFGEQEQQKLWDKLVSLSAKLVACVEPLLVTEYAGFFPQDLLGDSSECRCFEVLGIDVILDSKRKPYLLEVNTLPSFKADSPLDEDVKRRLIQQTFDLTCGSLVDDCPKGKHLQVPPPDIETYGDFERVFPPRSAKLIEQCEAYVSRSRQSVRSLFNRRLALRPLLQSTLSSSKRGSVGHKEEQRSAARRNANRRKTAIGLARSASALPALAAHASMQQLRMDSRCQSVPSLRPRELKPLAWEHKDAKSMPGRLDTCTPCPNTPLRFL